jgi:DnaJ-class molecular chaperone
MSGSGYKDYFQVLGVDRSADADSVKRAFRKLARQYHPDVNPGNASAEARFKEISEAYEVLSDPDKRRRYEQFGTSPVLRGGLQAREWMWISDVTEILMISSAIFSGVSAVLQGAVASRAADSLGVVFPVEASRGATQLPAHQ